MPTHAGPIRVFLLVVLTAILGLSPLVASAQDAPSPEATALLADHPWLADLDLSTPDAEMFLALRLLGLAHYAPALQQLAALSVGEQAAIREQVSTATPADGNALVEDLRVPMTLLTAVIEEATANGADPEWDIPAFDEVLTEIRAEGNSGAETFADLVAIAPQSSAELYLVRVDEKILQEYIASRQRLEELQGRLAAQREATQAGREALDALSGD